MKIVYFVLAMLFEGSTVSSRILSQPEVCQNEICVDSVCDNALCQDDIGHTRIKKGCEQQASTDVSDNISIPSENHAHAYNRHDDSWSSADNDVSRLSVSQTSSFSSAHDDDASYFIM